MRYFITIAFLAISWSCFAQPANDNCATATTLTNVRNFCSGDAAYTNVNATAGGLPAGSQWASTSPGNDVWFVFTAVAYDVNVTVIGNDSGGGTTGGTLNLPLAAVYSTDDCQNFNEQIGNTLKQGNTTTIYTGGLVIGRRYYIRVSGNNNNTGTFKLCINNYFQQVKAGQDCGTAKVLCSKETFTEFNVGGAGLNNAESAGSCLGSERNTAWYKWTAANNGTLTFTITPTSPTDDIDFVLYDLGPSGDCSNLASKILRCSASHGVECAPGNGQHYLTGLNTTSTDISEAGGCGSGKDGFVRFIDMQQGRVYALLVDNFSNPNNSFSIEFAGTGEFVGPQAAMNMVRDKPCTTDQNYTFTSTSTNYTSLRWNFGDGASVATSTQPGPHVISYSTPGIKTVTLEALGDRGCFTVASQSFTVGLKPPLPTISIDRQGHCLGETFVLSTPEQAGATYAWTGPDGFTSTEASVSIEASSQARAGVYRLSITINECTSDVASFTVDPFGTTSTSAFSIRNNNPCTLQQSFTFTNQSLNAQRYRWDFGDGASITSATTSGPFTITYTTPGQKTITLETEGSAGCSHTITQNLFVPLVLARPVITANKPNFCLTDILNLSTPVVPGATYRWTGPNNFTSDQPSFSIPVDNYNVAGTYSLVLISGDCSSEAASVVIPPILRNPVAQFTTDPIMPAKLSFPVTVRFYNQSQDADNYLWEFGDGSTSTDKDPQHTYTTAGTYQVTLTASVGIACNNSITRGDLSIVHGTTIFIPNTFTPNGDGINDQFVINITNLRTYRINIFNRYGDLLFTTTSVFESWDGTHKGQPMPVGTYYYVINGVNLNDEEIKQSGSITILR